MKLIELDAPNVSEREKELLFQCIDSGYVSTYGPFVPRFEQRFSEMLQTTKAVSTQSGTAALHMALYELGISAGDEIIVPALTFIATVNPIRYVGADPVFADVDENCWTISPAEIEKNISEKTRAIIPVHLFGTPCAMDSIMDIADKYNLHIIEDATESLGAKYRNKQTGTFGIFGCFSFNGNKIITTGGGGMIVSPDEKKMSHIKLLVNQGQDKSQGYYHPEIGFNYRMTNLEAALGLAQFEKLPEFLAQKKKFNNIYREELEALPFVRFQKENRHAKSSWWMTCILLDKKINLPNFQKRLRHDGIPTRRIFMPVVSFPPYKKAKSGDLSCSLSIYENGICLPTSTRNSVDDIYYVCKKIKEFENL